MSKPTWKIFKRGGLYGVLGPETPPKTWIEVVEAGEAEREIRRLNELIFRAFGILNGSSSTEALSAASVLELALPKRIGEGEGAVEWNTASGKDD